MQGMFRANGGCGYVKKPVFLMEKGPHSECFDPKRTLPVKKTLKVRYYFGRKSIYLLTYFEILSFLSIGESIYGKWVELRF